MSTSEARVASPEQVKGKALRLALLCVLGAALILMAALAYQTLFTKSITIAVDGEELTMTVKAWTVGEALDLAGVVLEEGDLVIPEAARFLREGELIQVVRGKRVVLHVDGERLELSVPGENVRDVLVHAGVRMGPLDRVEPVRETPLENGLEIRVIRVTQEEVVEEEPIPYRTLRWADPYLTRGEQRIVREGREGLLRSVVLVTYENGEVAHRNVLSREVVVEPIDQIIGEGSREALQVLQTPSGTYRYTKVIELEATAYYPGPESTDQWADGYTYTGLRAGYGVVAVDPNVIPLGTRLYIPGYGEAIAGDIGGAIKGYRIDLGFDTYQEAINFGRKRVTAYILAD